MTHPALAGQWQPADPTHYAALSFLARYRGDTLRSYGQDLRYFLRWCAERDIVPLEAQRPHLELYLRWMEQRALAPATIGRRFTTVAGFYRYAVIDGHCEKDPSLAVTKLRVPWEGQRRTVLHPLEYAALLTTARRHGPALARPGRAARDDRVAGRRDDPGQHHRPADAVRLRAAVDPPTVGRAVLG